MGRRRSGAGGSLRYVAATLLLATVAASALYAALDSVTDADLWWHLAVGRYIAEQHAIPSRDVFSYMADGAPWQWLSQVVLYAGFAAGGGRAVAMLKIVAVCLAFAIVTWIGWRRSSSLAAAAVAAVPVCRPYLDVRPNLVAFLGTLVLMGGPGVVQAGWASPRPRRLAGHLRRLGEPAFELHLRDRGPLARRAARVEQELVRARAAAPRRGRDLDARLHSQPARAH
jgi:hypothetical protein